MLKIGIWIIGIFVVLLGLYRLVFLLMMPHYEWYHQWKLGTAERSVNFVSFEHDSSVLHGTSVGDPESDNLLVFIHGSPGNSSAFFDYLRDETLSSTAYVVSLDRPGFGLSKPPHHGISLKEQSRIISARLQTFEEKHITLVGHSLGGPLITWIAGSNPALIDHLLVVAGSSDPDLEPNIRYMKYLTSPLTNWILSPTQAHAFQELIQHEEDLQQLASLLPLIQSKVTIIHGAKDTLVPVGNVDYLKDKLTVTTDDHILPEESHFLVWTQYDLIRDIILSGIKQPIDDR